MNLDNRSMILLLGVGLLAFWFVVRLNKRKPGQTDQTLAPEEQIERLRQSRGMHGDLERLMGEIEDLAKRLGQRLDAKSQQVERLLADADRRISELRRLQEQGPAAPSSAPHPSDASLPDDPLARSIYQLADAGHAPMDIARKLNEQIGKVELILALRKA